MADLLFCAWVLVALLAWKLAAWGWLVLVPLFAGGSAWLVLLRRGRE